MENKRAVSSFYETLGHMHLAADQYGFRHLMDDETEDHYRVSLSSFIMKNNPGAMVEALEIKFNANHDYWTEDQIEESKTHVLLIAMDGMLAGSS